MMPSIRRSRAVELAVLYEISSFEFSDDENRIAREALEMATRLFGARYFALLKDIGAEAYTLTTFGFKDASDLTRKLEERADNKFFSPLGNLGSIFLEQSHKVDTWERHLYMIFARQIEKALLNAKNTTERKLAEEASKRTEEEILLKHKQLLSIFDSIDEVIYVADPTTYELLYFNEAFKSRWKVNVGDKCYKVLQNQTSPCSFCSNKYIFGENLGKTYIWEWQNLVDRHWYRCIDRAIKWPDGRMVRYEMAIDVTERKQVENALRESEERYLKLVETTPTVIYTLSAKDGVFTSLNPAFEKITGWLCSEWLGKPFMPLIHPDDLPVAIESFQQVIQGEPQPPYELRILSKSGEYLVGEFLSIPHIESGKIVGEFGIARDITERKRAEEKLRKSEDRYRTLVENLTVGVYRNTADSHGNFVQANFAIAKMFGYDSVDEFMRIKVSDLYQESEDRKLFVEAITQTGSVTNKELRLKKKDGTPIWASVSARAHYDEKGNIDWMDGVIEDITERKKAEEELQKRLGELEIYYRATIGRESRIIELKHQVNELLERLGEKKKYGSSG
ncbi:MAG: PAS domain S-box protein [Bacteroidota bacterium]|nr:PAS domain S-box protein [Bacteroidota bacterium]